MRTRRKDYENAKWMKLVPFGALVLPYLANASGWILTEMGRQPWIVYGLLKVQDAVSPNLTAVDLLDFPDRLHRCLWLAGCCHGLPDEEIRHCRTGCRHARIG